jgi:lysine 2,3-aminomutase
MVGPGKQMLSPEKIGSALAYVRSRPEIWEVILTGGDPLVLSARRVGELMARLAAIPHLKIVRFHSRVPAVEPERVDDTLIAALMASGKTTYLAVHVNHPRELTGAARGALARLADAGIALLSPTVLLRGINDDPDVLAELMRAFVERRVRPYYLHQTDLAPGTSHFRVPIAVGQALVKGLRGRISGLAQPTYILDIPGGHGKAVIEASTIRDLGEGRYAIEDFRGLEHVYPPQED